MKQQNMQWLVIISIGCYWAWIQSLLFDPSFSSNTIDAAAVFLCNVGAHFLGLAVLALLAKRFAPYVSHKAFAITSTIVVTAASLAIYAGACFELAPLVLVGSVLAGDGSAVFLVMWGEAYSSMVDPNSRKTTMSISVVAAFALFVVVANLPEALRVIMIVIMPSICVAASTATYFLPTKDSSKTQSALPHTKTKETLPSWAKLLACAFLFSIPMAYFKTGVPEGGPTASFAVVLFLLVLIFSLDYLLRTKRSLTVLPHVFVLTISGGLLLLPFLTQDNPFVTGVLITAGSFSFRAYLYPICVQAAERSRMPAAQAFAIITCTMDGGQITGALLRNALSGVPESWFTNVTIAIVYMLFLVGFLFFTQRFEEKTLSTTIQPAPTMDAKPVASEATASDTPAAAPASTPATSTSDVISSIENQCRLAAEMFSLSPREQEITALLVRGRSIQSIAEDVMLSQNTVKTHVSHIYQKCETHSREELIRLIENVGSEQGDTQ